MIFNLWKVKIWFKKIIDGLSRISEKPILTSFIVLICLSFIVIGFSLPYYIWDFDNFYAQILAEAIYDLLKQNFYFPQIENHL